MGPFIGLNGVDKGRVLVWVEILSGFDRFKVHVWFGTDLFFKAKRVSAFAGYPIGSKSLTSGNS